MKIALIHYRLLLKGGLETRLFNYIDYFLSRGDEVWVIVSRIKPEVKLPEGVKLKQVKLRKFPKPVRQLLFDRQVMRFLQREAFDFSLSLGRTSGQDAVLAPGNHIGYLKALGQEKKRLSDRIQILLDRRAYRNSHYILAASNMMANEVKAYFSTTASIHVLYPPLDTRRFHQGLRKNREALREKYGFHPDKKTFLFISTGHKRKGLPLLLKLFRELDGNQVELVIAGSPAVNSELEHVRYIGFIANAQELYPAADFTIHPSVYEPYGQIVAESLACGTPVLVSTKVGAAEIVSEHEGEVVDSFEIGDWVGVVEKALNKTYQLDSNLPAEKAIRLEDHMEKMLSIVKPEPH